uniref:Uncharacterized protein n=1 Tax=Anguilla anguilla TaxID=7936 RepID=A0A0E9VKE1_ANGAN
MLMSGGDTSHVTLPIHAESAASFQSLLKIVFVGTSDQAGSTAAAD